MKKEKKEFTILRYLGRPPSLFDDTAIAAVAKILADNPKFDWEQFTEYATFHKLSQTLYPNLLTYNKSGSAKMRKCESSQGENAGNADPACGIGKEKEKELATSASAVPTARQEVHKEEDTCGAKEELTAKNAKTRQENIKTATEKNKFKFVAEFMFWNKTKYSNISSKKNLCELCALCGKKEDRLSSVECRDSASYATSSTMQDTAKKIPDVVINKFRGIFLANAARNEFLAQELVKINKLMADNGIEMLNWKGPALALQAYGDLSLRQFKDLDTLVKHEDLEKAYKLLLANGFEDEIILDEPKHELINKKQKYELEIQSKIFTPNTIINYDYDGMFERKKSQMLNTDEVYIQSLLDKLFFISFHGTKHLWFRLRWLADVLGLYYSNKEKILKGLKDFKQKEMCYFTIYLACKAFDIKPDKDIEVAMNKQLYKKADLLYSEIGSFKYKPDALLNYYHILNLTKIMLAGKENIHNLTKELYYCYIHTFIRCIVILFKVPSCKLLGKGNNVFKRLFK